MPIPILIALFIAAGVSFGAESANPGDFLYGVKVNGNEKIVSALKISNEGEATWQAELASRRLAEAEILASEKKLETNAATKLEGDFEAHASSLSAHIARLDSKTNAVSKAEVYSDFESKLVGHERVLANLETNADVNIKSKLSALLEKVRLAITTAKKERMEAEIMVGAQASVEIEAAARGKLKAAENKIAEVKGFLDRKSENMSAEAKTNAYAELALAESVLLEGKASLENELYSDAFIKFQESMRTAEEAKLIASSSFSLNITVNTNSTTSATGTNKSNQNSTNTKIEIENKLEIGI